MSGTYSIQVKVVSELVNTVDLCCTLHLICFICLLSVLALITKDCWYCPLCVCEDQGGKESRERRGRSGLILLSGALRGSLLQNERNGG